MKSTSTRLANKVALVTGAGSGIGRATAIQMASEGATAIVADIDTTAAQSVVNDIATDGRNATALQLDVADDSAWRRAVARILADYRQLNVLVNCAGISVSRPVAISSFEDWRKVMAVNLDGLFLGTRHALPAMKNGGSVVNVASVSGIKPSAGAAAYCTSKAAIRMFSKVLAIECADANTGIRVNVVTPGGVKTPMWEREEFFQALVEEQGSVDGAFAAIAGNAPSHQFLSPEDVAETIVYLASDEASHLTGTEIVLDRGHTG